MSTDEESNLFNDSPELAEVSSFELCEGDFIVIATDGLWDNLNESTILKEISKLKVRYYTVQSVNGTKNVKKLVFIIKLIQKLNYFIKICKK